MEAVKKFIGECTTCALKSVQVSKAPLKPIISKGFMERMQVIVDIYIFLYVFV